MITDLKPHHAMKDSGVPWLGEVPDHWTVLRMRNAAKLRVSNVDKNTKDGELAVRLCGLSHFFGLLRTGASAIRAAEGVRPKCSRPLACASASYCRGWLRPPSSG